jgi:PKD repeat protein
MRRHIALIIVCSMALAGLVGASSGAAANELSVLGKGAVKQVSGLYLIQLADGSTLFTHGPDPVPNHGGSIDASDTERSPVCATDYYQHVLYGRLTGSTDRFANVKTTIQSSMRRIDAVLNEESIASGNFPADYKVKCDANGAIQVNSFTASSYDYTSVVDGARAAGYTLSNVDYTIFFDYQPPDYCGVGSYYDDERLTASNYNNNGGGYAVAYNQCCTNETPMHENGHNQGAVQYGAPYSTGTGGHCYDENDVMCYSPDGGDLNQGGTIDRCTDKIHFDCGNDSYFDSATESGEYLASHWNIGSTLNRFIVFGPSVVPPKASMTISCTNLSCAFTDKSTDNGTIVGWQWSFGDAATSTLQNPTHTYAAAGTYLVSMTVTDNDGSSSSASQTLSVTNPDPDPSTPNLANAVAKTDRNGPSGTWKYYKIQVPQGKASLRVTLNATACTLSFCNPDLDLYVRPGLRPDTGNYSCLSHGQTDTEVCNISSPAGTYWYIGVYTFFATPEALLNLSTVNFSISASY